MPPAKKRPKARTRAPSRKPKARHVGSRANYAIGYFVDPEENARLVEQYKKAIQRAKWVTMLKRAVPFARTEGARAMLLRMIDSEKHGVSTEKWALPPNVLDTIARSEMSRRPLQRGQARGRRRRSY
jgi:hypothetical protein